MSKKIGPGSVNFLHVIDPVTAERRLCMQLETTDELPLAHLEMTRAEAVNLYHHVADCIQKIWPNTNLSR